MALAGGPKPLDLDVAEAVVQPAAMVGARIILLLGWLLVQAADGGTGCWVWNRSTPLTDAELRAVPAAGISTLYWHLAEIENRSGKWTWKSRLARLPQPTTAALRVVPVIRLETSANAPFAAAARAALRQHIVAALQPLEADEWQLDYDAPDRLVGDYAVFLSELRDAAPKLSSTALAGWVRLPEFGRLCASVAELYPMFYDLEPDTAAALRPLLEPDTTVVLLDAWRSHCQIPWKAGLPWFARLTLYGSDGKSRGHLRNWAWDEVVFRRELHLITAPVHGITEFRAEKTFAIGHTTLQAGETLVARRPDPTDLARIEKAAARDLVFFRLPDATAAGGGSLSGFAHRATTGATRLTLTHSDGHLALTNEGDLDLQPRGIGDGPSDRGYALEVDATGPVFREAGAGEFFRVVGHLFPDETTGSKPVVPDGQVACPSVPLATATRLTFWFSALPAGSSLESGIFQLAPAAAALPLRYRILNSEAHPPWQPLAPAS